MFLIYVVLVKLFENLKFKNFLLLGMWRINFDEELFFIKKIIINVDLDFKFKERVLIVLLLKNILMLFLVILNNSSEKVKIGRSFKINLFIYVVFFLDVFI